jgi:magnesium transporter
MGDPRRSRGCNVSVLALASGTYAMVMTWHDVVDPGSLQLDQLAEDYFLHPLHVEDCRQSAHRIKVESDRHYLFIVVKLLDLEQTNKLAVEDLVLFVGSDFLITVHRSPIGLLDALRELGEKLRTDQVLYRLANVVVDSYLPLIDKLEDIIERLHDQVVSAPRPNVLERIGEIRSVLTQLRRVLSNTRHVAFQLRHVSSPFISQELSPFLRDVHDDLAIDLDIVAAEQDRLASALEVYLSSVANRTTEATRTLTLLGTAALPALVITSLFGMNIAYPSWTKSTWIFAVLVAVIFAITGFLLWYLRRRDYLPGGSTSRAPLQR